MRLTDDTNTIKTLLRGYDRSSFAFPVVIGATEVSGSEIFRVVGDVKVTGEIASTDFVASTGATINEFSTDGTLAGNSDTAVPTEKAVKTYVDNNIGGVFSGAQVYITSNQSIGTGSTLVNFGGEKYDSDSYHDNSTNNSRLTVPADGKYRLTFDGTVIESGMTRFACSIFINGSLSRDYAFNQPSSAAGDYNLSKVFDLSSGDYIEIKINTSPSSTAFSGVTNSRLEASIEKL